MGVEELPPGPVPERRSLGGGVDDIAEEHGREHAGVGDLSRAPLAGEEGRDLVAEAGAIAEVGQMIPAVEELQRSVRDLRGEEFGGGDVDDHVVAPMHDERGDAHLRQDLADVDVGDEPPEPAQAARADRGALEAGEEVAALRHVAVARGEEVHRDPAAPAPDRLLDQPL